MKKITLIFIALATSLLAKDPSDASYKLVDLMKLAERYQELYRIDFIESERNKSIDLPEDLQVQGLRKTIALHFDGYLTEKELTEAIDFFSSPAGKKVASATYRSDGNFLVLDTKVEQWFTFRSRLIKEKLEKLRPGGPYIKNLQIIVSAGHQYMLEQKKEKVSYRDLVDLYIKEIEPINGEDYQDLVIYKTGGKVSVTNADGEVFEFSY